MRSMIVLTQMSTQTNTETTPAMKAPKRKRVNLTLTPETHGRIKVWCARRGVTMQAQIEKWLDGVAETAALRGEDAQ
jgi:hypothetical protein